MAKNEIQVEIVIEGLDAYKNTVDEMTQYTSKLKQKLHELAQAFNKAEQEQKAFFQQLSKLSTEIHKQGSEIVDLSFEVTSVTGKFADAKINASNWAESIEQTTGNLKELQEQTKSTADGIDKMNGVMDKTSSKNSSLKLPSLGTVLSSIKDGAEVIFELEEQTREYRKTMANLESTSLAARYSAETTAASYEQLYSVLGDDNSAVRALTTLQSLKINHEQLPALINASIGAWATYGEKIPIESLSEAMSETVKIGKSTGVFSQLLSELGIKEDEFNAKLQATNNETTRMDAIMQTLSENGLVAAGIAWQENNQALIESYTIAAQLTEGYAKLSDVLLPAINAVKEAWTGIINAIADFLESGNADALVRSISGIIFNLLDGVMSTIPTVLDALWQMLVSIVETLHEYFPTMVENGMVMLDSFASGLLKGLPSMLAAAAVLLGQLLDTIAATFPQMVLGGISLIEELAFGIVENIPEILGAMMDLFAVLLGAIVDHLPNMLESGIVLIGELIAGMISAIPNLISAVLKISAGGDSAFLNYDWKSIGTEIINGVATGINSAVGSIVEAAKNAAYSAFNAAKKFLGISSPSKLMRDEIGKFIPEGIAVGIEANTNSLSAAMNGLSELAVSSFHANLQYKTSKIAVPNTHTYSNNTFSINVYGAEGQNVNALADAVMDRMQMLVTQKEVAFSV